MNQAADYDPIGLRVMGNLLESVAEEMGTALERSGVSPNIKERRDYSCAIFDANAELVAQAAHMPVHLGAMPISVSAAQQQCPLLDGDIVILNDPRLGGTHLPDITTVQAFRIGPKDEKPLAYLATRAHHADVGGSVPGSMGITSSLEEEGIVISPSHGSRAAIDWMKLNINIWARCATATKESEISWPNALLLRWDNAACGVSSNGSARQISSKVFTGCKTQQKNMLEVCFARSPMELTKL